MRWLIYKHTSPSGKIYIGQTMQVNPQVRWQYGNGYKAHNTIFYQAIKKYGWHNFTHEIIEADILTQQEANEREMYWISFYDSFRNGYNATQGGNSVGDNAISKPVFQIQVDNPDVIYKEFRSAQEAGRITGICSRNIGACCLKQGQITAGGYYWCFCDDFKDFKPLKKMQGKTNLRKVYCFETDAVYNSIAEASKKLGIGKDGIFACCKYKQITAGKCHFCYYEDVQDYVPKEKKKYIGKTKPLYQIDVETLRILREFTSPYQASQYTQISSQQIKKCLINTYISAGGFYWCEKDKWFEGWTPQRQRHSNAKAVYCIETNQKFAALADASKITGINISSISECCNKKLNTAGGLHWCFFEEFSGNEYSISENKNYKKVVCVETKEMFDKIRDAAAKYNLRESNISQCLKNPSRTSGGFHWCYLEDFGDNYIVPKQRQGAKKKVLNIDTGEVFDSIRDAARKYDICEQNIYRVCKNKSKTAGGYRWKYLDNEKTRS